MRTFNKTQMNSCLPKKFNLLLFFLLFSYLNAQQEDFIVIKSRLYQSIIDDNLNIISNEQIGGFDPIINKIIFDFDGEKWPYIQYSDVSREGFDNTIHLNHLVKMAVAYKSSISKYFNDKSLLRNIINGLRFWCDNDFIGENWWNNQIGTPRSMVELMLVIGEEFQDELIVKSQEIINRADINSGGSRPGGDRIKVSSIAAKNQLFLNNPSEFELIIDIIENEIKFVDWIGNDFGYTFSKSNTGGFNEFLKANGRGLQYDHSFHHRTDGVNNTLSYGLNWAQVFAWDNAKRIRARKSIDDQGVKLYEIYGPLFFGSISAFNEKFDVLNDPQEVIIDFRESRIVDMSAIEALNKITERYLKIGKKLQLRHLSQDCQVLLKNADKIIDVNVLEDPNYKVLIDEI